MQKKIIGGRYKLKEKIGGGAFGQTYLAEDSQLPGNPLCIVKQLQPQNTDPKTLQTARRLFNSEAQVLHTLGTQHPQIPTLYAYFEEDKEFYLVQELVRGNPLTEELPPGIHWQEVQAIDFLQDILSILDYVHQQQVIHRDIKPSNIMRRTEDQKLMLIDFGAVKQIRQSSDSNDSNLTVAISTYGYSPPEQLQGKPHFSSDIYAVGMTAIRALTGIHPHQLDRDSATGELIWKNRARVSEGLVAILDRMVASHLPDRYPSASAVLADLDRLRQVANDPTRMATSDAPTRVAGDISLTTPPPPMPPPPPAGDRQPPTAVRPGKGIGGKMLGKPQWVAAGIGGLAILAVLFELIFPVVRPPYYVGRGNRLLEDDRPEAAREMFDRALDLNPNSAGAWVGQGDALAELGRSDRALTAYNKALEYRPDNPDLLNKKGSLLYQTGASREALAAHEQAIAIDPDNAQAWYGKGIALIGLRQYEEAEVAFDRAKSIRPQVPSVWQSKAVALEYQGKRQEARQVYEEALATYDDVLDNQPEKVAAWVDRGAVLSKLGRPEQALESYEKALAIDPDDFQALLKKSNVLFPPLRRIDEALAASDRVLEIRPDSHLAWHNRGSILAGGKRDFEGAIAAYDRAIELRPQFVPAMRDKGLALSQWSQVLQAEGKTAEAEERADAALESFDRALSADPDDYQSLVGRAIVLSNRGRQEAALAALNKARDIQPGDPFVWVNRGLVLEKMGRNTEAIESYDEALKIQPDFGPALESKKQLTINN
ncbi:MAG: tetratricopeptide repeat protein [Limnospira sp.]